MTEKNGHDNVHVDTTETAIVVRIASQAGPRAIEMQFGVPLNMNLKQLNEYMDKATSIIDRQIAIGDLRKIQMDLEGAQKALATHLEQRANYESQANLDWEISGRKGGFKPSGSQQAQFANFDKTIHELRDNRIPHFKAEIERLKRETTLGA